MQYTQPFNQSANQRQQKNYNSFKYPAKDLQEQNICDMKTASQLTEHRMQKVNPHYNIMRTHPEYSQNLQPTQFETNYYQNQHWNEQYDSQFNSYQDQSTLKDLLEPSQPHSVNKRNRNLNKSNCSHCSSDAESNLQMPLEQQQQNQQEQKRDSVLEDISRIVSKITFNNGNPTLVLTLKLKKVLMNTQLALQKEDIHELFSRYGNVKKVKMINTNQASIKFDDEKSAFFAKKHLNGMTLPFYDVKLEVKWQKQVVQNQNYDFGSYQQQGYDQPNLNINQQYIKKRKFSRDDRDSLINFSEDSKSTAHSTKGKFTQRYEIQIKKDNIFDAPKRIIGPNGSNMKQILEKCQNEFPHANTNGRQIKIRLRGQGSGHKEGPHKQESKEPMHLCISSKFEKIFEYGSQLVEELLQKIYQDHQQFCEKNGMQYEKLQIKKMRKRKRHNQENKFSKKQKKNNHSQKSFQRIKKQKNLKLKINNNYNQMHQQQMYPNNQFYQANPNRTNAYQPTQNVDNFQQHQATPIRPNAYQSTQNVDNFHQSNNYFNNQGSQYNNMTFQPHYQQGNEFFSSPNGNLIHRTSQNQFDENDYHQQQYYQNQ